MKKRIRSLYHSSGWLVFIVLVVIEVLAARFPTLGQLGSWLWMFSYLYIAIFTFTSVLELVIESLKHKLWISPLLIIVLLGSIAIQIPQAKNLSGEGTLETGCALRYLQNEVDRGFQKTCLFGYPARQHFIPSLPSLIIGRNILALHLGGSIYFILGLLIFSSGLLKFYNYTRIGDFLAGLVIGSLLHIYFVNHMLFTFEQGIFPFSLALITTGLFLYFQKNTSFNKLYLIGLSLLYLIFSYTPSLAYFLLGLIILSYYIFILPYKKTDINKKLLLIFIAELLILACIVSLRFRGDLIILNGKDTNPQQLLNDLKLAFEHILFQRNGLPMVSPIFSFVFLFIVLAGLLGNFGKKIFVVSLWILGTIIFSVISRGYNYYVIEFRLHRAIVIFPAFLTVFAFLLGRIDWTGKKKFLVTSLLLIIFSGFAFQNHILAVKDGYRYFPFIAWLNQSAPRNSTSSKNLYLIGDGINEYGSLNDFLQYFNPQLIATVALNDPSGFPCNLSRSSLYVLPQASPCFARFSNLSRYSSTLSYLGDYTSETLTKLFLFESK